MADLRKLRDVVRLLGLTLVAYQGASCSGGHDRALRNIVLITVDTLRADVLGCYGNAGGHSPHMDRLAEEGVVFDSAYAPMATTFPSHATLLTAKYPREHGVRWNGDTLGSESTTLAEILGDAGYRTASFVSYGAMVRRGGLDQGFQETGQGGDPAQSARFRAGSETVELAAEWVRGHVNRNGEPFFLWVHLFDAHTPYLPGEWTDECLAGYRGSLAGGVTAEHLQAFNTAGPLPSQAEVAAVRAFYEQGVRRADLAVGELVGVLRESGFWDQACVVLAGDHGELLGEDGLFGHGAMLHGNVLRVPLVIKWPGAAEGSHVRDRVGLVDVMPTILELLDVPLRFGTRGRSLASALFGRSLETRDYFAEVRGPGLREPEQEFHRNVAVYQGDWKLELRDGAEWIYEVRDGVERELHSIGDADPSVLRNLRELLEDHQGTSGVLRPSSSSLGKDDLDELRSLGYLGSED